MRTRFDLGLCNILCLKKIWEINNQRIHPVGVYYLFIFYQIKNTACKTQFNDMITCAHKLYTYRTKFLNSWTAYSFLSYSGLLIKKLKTYIGRNKYVIRFLYFMRYNFINTKILDI